MKYTDGKTLYKKNAAEWALAIFFEELNGAYGFMERYMYNFLVGKEVERNDKEFVYMPEVEFLGSVASQSTSRDFSKIYQDSMERTPSNMPFFEKIRCRRLLSEQQSLDPRNCMKAIDVHENRKVVVIRWFQCYEPYLQNYKLACQSSYPGIVASTTSKLKKSVELLEKRDSELGKKDIAGLSKVIEKYVHGC